MSSNVERKRMREQARHGQKLMKRISEDHPDVLQNIEMVLATAHRENGRVDDKVVMDAVQAGMLGYKPAGPIAQQVWQALAEVRATRDDVPDKLWRQALSVVIASVLNHSELKDGQTDYLEFVGQFLP